MTTASNTGNPEFPDKNRGASNEETVTDFRQAMRRMAATVSIITVEEDGEWIGMAATSAVSISMDPPSILISVNRTAKIHAPLLREGSFCINMLNTTHKDLVSIFGGKVKGPERFKSGRWEKTSSGGPRLEDAMVNLACVVDSTMEYGSHTLVIGRVTEVRMGDEVEPLLWLDGMCGSANII